MKNNCSAKAKTYIPNLKDWVLRPKGLTDKNNYFNSVNGLSWNQRFYLNLEEEVHPFNDLNLFRPLDKAYTGNNTFWSTPSPEPDLNDAFWRDVELSFKNDSTIQKAVQHLAASILQKYPNPEKILFVSILRAGVPITDWLCQLLPGSMGAAISLFVGLGIDRQALNRMRRDFPDRSIIFVDGWTGRGGVAKTIFALDRGPLAVLMDPWGWADFFGIQADVFCPSACFTGLATLGFSRTFFVDKNNFFSAYRFSDAFSHQELIKCWQDSCPRHPTSPPKSRINKFFTETPLRIHSNEVCRALINAAPETLFFADDKSFAEQNFSLLLKLADQRSVPLKFNVNHVKELNTKVACSLKKAK
ncbi:MAG: tellurite-like stress resistance cysteine protease StiP [Thermodesulfobacteriota bacterium]|nr:tellurite-like stress resistance cysteine protease StiP [Thermodesulfobacteriota bacterium]